MSTAPRTGSAQSARLDRIAAGPISWGVCEVPNWGLQLPPEHVLAEMRSLGISGTEAGPDGYLGDDRERVRALLEQNGLELVGGFLPVVLHDPAQLDASLAKVRRTAAFLGELGGRVLCSAAVVDDDWAPRFELSDAEWEHLLVALPLVDAAAAEHGVEHVLHPHWGTLVQEAAEVARVLDGSGVAVCLDTGHLALGRADALAIARTQAQRIGHVHLKDVDGAVAERLRSGELSLVEATRAGLFRPLGTGSARVGEVVAVLEHSGYGGWYVLEQDAALGPGAQPGRALEDARTSIEFLRNVLRPTEGALSRTTS